MRLRYLRLAGCFTIGFALSPAFAQDTPNTNGDADFHSPINQEFGFDLSNRMTVPVRINGHEAVPFLVDTASERTVISHDLANLLALEKGPMLTLSTIAGRSEVASFLINKLAMTAVNVEGVEAPALDRDHMGAFGIIGIDSLQDQRVLLDFRNKKMEVLQSKRNPSKSKLEKGMIVVNATRKLGRMIISNARIDGMNIDVVLDTGAQTSMGNLALRQKLRRFHRVGDYRNVKMLGVTGEILPGQLAQIKNIEVGGILVHDLPVTFSDNYAFEALNLDERPAILLGMDALRLFDRVLIDFENRRVGFDVPRANVIPVRYTLSRSLADKDGR